MDINLEKITVKSRNNVLNSKYDLPFEIDCTLPDYCRDVEKLLSSNINPVVCSVFSDDSKVTIEGNNFIEIYYCDKENNISKYESKVPFSKIIDFKSKANNPAISVKAYEGYINCRAVSPRRLDIRGTTQIELYVNAEKEEKIIQKIPLNDIETNIFNFENAEFIGQYSKQFTIKDSIDTKIKSIEHTAIIKYTVSPAINEYKILPDKTILKGLLFINICFYNEKDKKISTEAYKLPFSQIIDCNGIDEDCICDFCVKVINSEICLGNDEENKEKLNISATLCADIKGYRKKETCGIKDCFCHSCDCSCKNKNVNIFNPILQINNDFNFNETVLLDDYTEIKDVTCKIISSETEYIQNTVKLKLRAVLSVLGIKNNSLCCTEKVVSSALDISKNIKSDCLYFNPCINLINCSYSDINNGKAEINCTLRINGIIFDKLSVSLVDNIKPEPKASKNIDNDLIIIYYTHSREDIWDIAKRYNSSVNNIKKYNKISSDYVEKGKVILITPFKQTPLME